MKQIRLHIGMIAVLLTFMLAACTDCIVDNETSSNEAEDGYYTAHFNVSIPSFEQQVTRSTLFTNEGIGKTASSCSASMRKVSSWVLEKSGNSVKSKVSEET